MELKRTILLLLVAVSTVSAFDFDEATKNQPKSVSVKEGGTINLSCTVDNYYEWCTFVHNDKICDYEWKKPDWNITLLDCSDFSDRKIRFSGEYEKYNCAIELKDVKAEDAGEWKCKMESYHAGRYRTYGYQIEHSINVDIELTTTTSTTTTTTTRPGIVTRNDGSEEELENSGTAAGQTDNGTSNATTGSNTEEPSSNAGYIVIVVIIVILIASVIVLVGLHYKRKLPESFYNLGGLIKGDKQWKPVLAKDEDDLKKHPTIVKNGGANGTANGSSNETPEGDANEGDDSKINPDMTTVTWTSEKTEADLHEDAEQKPLQGENEEKQ